MTKRIADRPDDLDASLRAIVRDVKRITRDYRWAHNHAFGSPGTPLQPGRSTGHSDPTGASIEVDAKLAVRSALAQASRDVDVAQKALGSALRSIGNALQRAKPGQIVQTYPRVMPQELKEALDARDRRSDRGEGFGAS